MQQRSFVVSAALDATLLDDCIDSILAKLVSKMMQQGEKHAETGCQSGLHALELCHCCSKNEMPFALGHRVMDLEHSLHQPVQDSQLQGP